MTPIKIQLLLDGAQQVSQALGKLVNDARSAFSGMSQAGRSSAAGMATAEQSVAALTARIELSNRAFERLRQSGKLTAEQLAKVQALRDARNAPREQERSGLQAVAGARDTLGVRAYADIQAETLKVRQAYAVLAASGKLTHAELLQASLRQQQAVAELRAQTNGWAQSLATVRGQLASLAGAAVGITLAAREAIAFESAMADVRKVVDATPEGFAQITRSIRDLSAELPVSAVGLAQMAEAGGQLGIAGERIPEFVRLASEMSVAFKMSAEESGNAVGKLGNIFGLTLPQVRALADSVNALGDSTAATERDIVAVLQRTGGLGRQFGLNAQQTAALADAFLSLGDPPEIAATAINNLLGKLQAAPAQSAEFQRALRVLGIDAQALAKHIETDAAGALRGFLGTLEKLDAKSRSQALAMMFGGGGDTASIAKLVGELGKLDTALATAGSTAAAGGLGRALKIQTDTADAQLKILRNNVGDIGVAIGPALLPAIKAFADLAGAVARLLAAVVDAAPWLVLFAGVAGTVTAASKALGMAWTAISLAAARAGVAIGTATPVVAAGGTAAAGASLGVRALGAAFRFLLGPVGLAILAIEGLVLAWQHWQDAKAKDASKTAPDLQAELERIRQERTALEARMRSSGQYSVAQAAAINAYKRQEADLQTRIAAKARETEDALRASAGPRGGTGEGYDSGEDITARLKAASDAAQAAAKARIAANREAAGAIARLNADANAATLADLQRNLERETVSLQAFYDAKRVLAERDADAQIAIKRQAIAEQQAFEPASDADREARRGALARLNAELAQLLRARGRIALDLGREQADAQLKLIEDAQRRQLALQQRGVDDTLALARQARALGLMSAAGLAGAEALAAERRVQIEIDAARRILKARQDANAPAASLREAADLVDAATARQEDARTQRLADIGQRVRDLREQSAGIRLQLDADPARRAVGEAQRDLARLHEQADSDAAVLRVQLAAETDPQARARIQVLLEGLGAATREAVVARNDRLADDLKPGWQKMVEGWRDAHKLMRDAADQTMDLVVRGGEDAFAEFFKTGKFNLVALGQEFRSQLGRLAWRQIGGSETGQAGTSWLAGMLGAGQTLKGYSGREGDPTFMGPVQQDAGAAASEDGAAAMQSAATAAQALATAAQGGASGASLLGTALQLAQATQTTASSALLASFGTLALAAEAAALALGKVATGSSVKMLAAATGGLVTGPGTGTSDDVPAMLSNGEFVVRAAAVRRLGVAALERINQADRSPVSLRRHLSAQRMLPAFAAGGLVGGTSASTVRAAGLAGPSISVHGGPIHIDARSDAAQVAQIVRAAQQQERRALFAELRAVGVLK